MPPRRRVSPGSVASWRIAVAVGLAGLLSAARPARACSPLQGPDSSFWRAFGGSFPIAEAREVAPDAPVVFVLNTFRSLNLDVPKSALPEGALTRLESTVTVVDQTTGQEVPGTTTPSDLRNPRISWRPRAPLLAGHKYQASAELKNYFAQPEGASGETKISLAFTAGATPLPRLTAGGESNVFVEAYTAPRLEPGTCGGFAESLTATEPARRTHVYIPPVTGGFTGTPYRARTVITRDRAYDFPTAIDPAAWLLNDVRTLAAGESGTIVHRLPNDLAAGTSLCAITRYEDEAGKVVTSTSNCATVPEIKIAAPASPSDPSGAPAAGCSLSRATATSPAGMMVAFLALVLRRRRRGPFVKGVR